MTRVEIRLQAVVETYDTDGNLLSQQAVQPLTVAGLSPGAVRAALLQAGAAIVDAAWPPLAADLLPDEPADAAEGA